MYHKNWNYAFAIMNGIKKTAKICKGDKFSIKSQDFQMRNTIEMCSMSTKEFDTVKFTDVAPKVFYTLRMMYGINPESYIQSLGIQNLAKMNKKYGAMS